MQQRSHFRAVGAVAISLLVVACGDANSSQLPPSETIEPPAMDPLSSELPEPAPGSQLQFRIDGQEGPMDAQARLTVQEGVPTQHLAITGGNDGNILLIDLTFEGIENIMGPHSVEFALPYQGDTVANASLEGAAYYSQGGTIDVRLSANGAIEGVFNVSLAPDQSATSGEPTVFEATDDATAMTGGFSGPWILSCHSRLAGHSSLVPGGEYCDQLEF